MNKVSVGKRIDRIRRSWQLAQSAFCGRSARPLASGSDGGRPRIWKGSKDYAPPYSPGLQFLEGGSASQFRRHARNGLERHIGLVPQRFYPITQVAQAFNQSCINEFIFRADNAIHLALAICNAKLPGAIPGERFHFRRTQENNQCTIKLRYCLSSNKYGLHALSFLNYRAPAGACPPGSTWILHKTRQPLKNQLIHTLTN